MATWAIVDARLKRLLKDESGVLYAAELRKDGFNAAQEVFAAHTALTKTLALTGDGSVQEWTLPADRVDAQESIEAIWDEDGRDWLEEIKFAPGQDWGSGEPRGYYLWPQDKVNTTFAPKSGQKLTLYYYAAWPDVSAEASPIALPKFGIQACLFYAAAYCLLPDGVQAATIRQYNTGVDSGNPEHNPVHEQARFWLKLYQDTINRFKPQQKGMLFTPGRGD